MTAQEFDELNDNDKKILLFEATKLGQRLDDSFKNELFQIEDFYVESTISRSLQTRRKLRTYLPHQLNEIFSLYETLYDMNFR